MALTERYVSSLAGGGGDGSVGSPWTLVEATNNVSPGDKVWVKSDGAYNHTSANPFDISGSDTNWIEWEGYTSSTGDGGTSTIDIGASYLIISGTSNHFKNLLFTGSRDSYILAVTTGVICSQCRFATTGTGSNTYALALTGKLIDCIIDNTLAPNTTVGAMRFNSYNGAVHRVTVNTRTNGIELASANIGGSQIRDTTIKGTGSGSGIVYTYSAVHYATVLISGCVICNFANGVYYDNLPDTNDANTTVSNSIIYDCDYGFYNAGATTSGLIVDRVAFGAITSSNYFGINTDACIDDITLTAPPFMDYAGGDYRLNNVSGGGAECKNIAVPLLDGVHTTYVTLGAINEARRVMLGLQLKT